MEEPACQVEKPAQHPWQRAPRRYLLALQRLVDGEVSVVVHAENDDFPGVVEPGRSRDVNPLVVGGYDGGDGVTWKGGGRGVRICLPAPSRCPVICFPLAPSC